MRWILTLVVALASLTSVAAPEKKFNRFAADLKFGHAMIALPSTSSSDPGSSAGASFFISPKWNLNAHYFATVAPSGSSNLNGFGLGGKYYFYNTETSFEFKDRGTVRTFDRWFSYVGMSFLDRSVRTSRQNISFTGFGLSLGAGYKLNYHNALGLEIQRGALKNASGSAQNQDADFTFFSFSYTYLF